MTIYFPGTRLRHSYVTQLNGVDTDPTALTLEVISGTGTRTLYTYGTDAAFVKDSTAHYHVDLTYDVSGTWTRRLAVTGAVTTAYEWELYIQPHKSDQFTT